MVQWFASSLANVKFLIVSGDIWRYLPLDDIFVLRHLAIFARFPGRAGALITLGLAVPFSDKRGNSAGVTNSTLTHFIRPAAAACVECLQHDTCGRTRATNADYAISD